MTLLPRMAVAVVAAVLFPVIGAAQQPAPPGGRGAMRGAPMARQAVSQRPQLSAEQREQLRTFDEQHRTATETTRRELGELHGQLDEALTAAQVDSSKVNQLRASIVQKETALAQHRVDRLTKVSSMLTAEQRESLRGRGLGRVFGASGLGGSRGAVMAQPRVPRPPAGTLRGRAPLRQRMDTERQLRGRILQRQAPRAPSGQLRAEIRRLEAQLEALRRRIR
ncbi:MAG: periplasmic heavy metal sensor [Vicinamibacterales bacterium]